MSGRKIDDSREVPSLEQTVQVLGVPEGVSLLPRTGDFYALLSVVVCVGDGKPILVISFAFIKGNLSDIPIPQLQYAVDLKILFCLPVFLLLPDTMK